ncbi:MAG: class I SAM-dependent methyltransferase [Spirochaetaceae bacterium]|jgi:23S rRNA G2069 N7-methylase RlmK/C1962 C5-methylase RlmI|nr:class I SAM-dependent methyltransferase [Spirochaetaceae bacterium]
MTEQPLHADKQAVFFANRLVKWYRHLRKWAARTDTGCYRLYDRDIPEIPLSVDLYTEASPEKTRYLCISLYERPYEKSDAEEQQWIKAMIAAASEALNIPVSDIFSRIRRRQKGTSQYTKSDSKNRDILVREGGLLFRINLSDYLDTGLFLDHRNTREMVRKEASGKSVLNLFCYTGAFSVYAAAGGAAAVDSVDLSNTYLSRARENFRLNGFSPAPGSPWSFICADTMEFLRRAGVSGRRWDLIILDPPTFSNSHKTESVLDINRDWPDITAQCLKVLSPAGVLYFSSNSRKLKFDPALLPPGYGSDEITARTIPEDFRNHPPIHRCYRIFPEKI